MSILQKWCAMKYAKYLRYCLRNHYRWQGRGIEGSLGDIKDANAINCGLMTVLRNAFSVPVTKRELNSRAHKITISQYSAHLLKWSLVQYARAPEAILFFNFFEIWLQKLLKETHPKRYVRFVLRKFVCFFLLITEEKFKNGRHVWIFYKNNRSLYWFYYIIVGLHMAWFLSIIRNDVNMILLILKRKYCAILHLQTMRKLVCSSRIMSIFFKDF